MNREQMMERRDYLVEQNKRLKSELSELDSLMRLSGFTDGLETVKVTAEELARVREENNDLAA